jgi:hypothetical protein
MTMRILEFEKVTPSERKSRVGAGGGVITRVLYHEAAAGGGAPPLVPAAVVWL